MRGATSGRAGGGLVLPAVHSANEVQVLLEKLEDRLLLSVAPVDPAATVFAHTTAILESISPSSVTLPSTWMTPSKISTAYGFDQLLYGSVQDTGSGQTVAIIDVYDDPTALNDLNQFSLQFGLPQFNVSGGPTFTKVGENGSSTLPAPSGSSGWSLEESLDIEWVHAIAPDANILLVEAKSASDADLIETAVPWAASQPGVVAVSMSFSGSEFSGENTLDSYFTTPAGHAGVTFLAATGDSGTPAGYPAYSPNVVAVGGTTLNTDSSGDYISETGWSGSGGGISEYESLPSYQSGSYQNGSVTQTTTMRTAPDVSMDADPNTGVAVYDSYDYPSDPWVQIGGTSVATPIWAGLMALVDQVRSLAHLSSLDGATQTLPALYKLPAADFHDITSGSNGSPNYSAGVGYDLVTGLGTPVANKLIPDLAGVGAISGTVFQDNNGNGVLDAGETGLSGVTVYVDSNSNGVLNSGVQTTVASTNVPVTIPSNSSTGVTSSLSFVSNENLITHVSVTLSITVPTDSGLTVYLIAPDGTQVTLFSGVGGSGSGFTNTTLDDGGSTSIASGSAPFTGTFSPSTPLSTLIGHWAGGTWKLKIVNSLRHNSGTLTSWSLTLTTAEDSATTDVNGNYSLLLPSSASYTVRQVAPANNVQTGPSPGANPVGANVVSLGTSAVTGQNFADFPTVLAAPGATDSYYVKLDSTGTYVQISDSNAPLPTPTYQIALAFLPSLTFNLLGSDNSVYVDFSNGSPVPANEITVSGAANATDTLAVIGQSSSQAFTLSNALIGPTGGAAIAYSNIATLSLQNGTTSFAGTVHSGPAMVVGAGATLTSGDTLDRSVTLLGGSLSGAMTINGSLTSTGGTISPAAGSGDPGTLTVVGNVSLDQGTTLNYQLSAPNVSGGSGNDLITITGDLAINGTLQVVGLTGFGAGAYTLFDYTGALSGAGLTIGASVPGGGLNYRLTSGGGQVNLVASLWALGDVNHDGVINSLDLDAIYANLGSVASNLSLAQYDVDGDNVVSQADVTYELVNILHCSYGDANLDGKVDFTDFQTLLDHWQVQGVGWAQGNFNGDGVVDFLDFQILLDYWNPGGVTMASQSVAPATSTPATSAPATEPPSSGVAASLAATTSSTADATSVSQPLTPSAAATTSTANPTASTGASSSAGAPVSEAVSATPPPSASSDASGAVAEAGYSWDDGQVDLLTHLQKPVFAWAHPAPH